MNSTSRRRPGLPLLVALLVALLAALVACGGGASPMSGDSNAGAAMDAPAEAENGFDTGSDISDSVGVAEAPDEATPRARTLPQTRAVISKGSVDLHAEDVAAARFEVLEVMDSYDGEVSDEETSTDDEGDLEYSRMVLRVPSGDFSEAMADLAGIATLESSRRSSEDVTTQVIDTTARVRAQERSLRRIEALLAEAADLRQVIAIESQLASRQAELDSLKQQLAYLSDQTSMSRIVVHLDRLEPEETEEVEEDDRAGFLVGLGDGWSALGSLASGTARVIGVLLPFAGALLLLAIPAWLLVRTVRRHRPAATASGSADQL